MSTSFQSGTTTQPGGRRTGSAFREQAVTHSLGAQAYAWGIAAITVAGAALRLPTLDVQSYWLDESVTVNLLRKGFGGMLGAIPDSESTPPAYYVIAWVWTRLAGTGEVGLRSLSALFGIAAIPIAGAAAAKLVSRGAGLVTAILIGANPLLVWYSQEARAYALLVLLSSLSLLLFANLRESFDTRTSWSWAIVCSLALATHYFAVFLVAGEAVLLLRDRDLRRRFVPALTAVGIASTLLFQLVLLQRGNPDDLGGRSLSVRMVQLPKQYLIGFDAPHENALALSAAALILIGLLSFGRMSDSRERRGTLSTAGVGAVAVVLPLVLALGGEDHISSRNMLGAMIPWTILVATGFAASRFRVLLLSTISALFVYVLVETAVTPAYQRSDWRGATAALGEATVARAIVAPQKHGFAPLEIYLPGSRVLTTSGAFIGEVDLIGIATKGRSAHFEALGNLRWPDMPRTFTMIGGKRSATFTVLRFGSPRTVWVTQAELASARLGTLKPETFMIQPANVVR